MTPPAQGRGAPSVVIVGGPGGFRPQARVTRADTRMERSYMLIVMALAAVSTVLALFDAYELVTFVARSY